MSSSAVLVLNATYEPLPNMVSVKRAIALVLLDKADIVETSDGTYVRSASIQMPAPSVIRLRYYVRVPWKRRELAVNRRNVLDRDDSVCAYCGDEADSVDHIIPTSRGGANTWMNVIASCTPCNSRKDNKTPEEADMKLLYQPSVPTGKSWLVVGWKDREQQAKYIPEHIEARLRHKP